MAIIDSRHAAKQLIYERIFRSATLSAALLVLMILGGVTLSLVHGSWPALKLFGFSFVTREIWTPVTAEYGALGPIYGTVVTSLIAIVVAVPWPCECVLIVAVTMPVGSMRICASSPVIVTMLPAVPVGST